MRFPFFFFLIFFLSSLALAQEKTISVEAALGPRIANRILFSNGSFVKLFDDEGPIITYEATLRSFYALSEKWSAGLGVIYSKKGFNAGNISFLDVYGKASYVLENYLIVVNYIEVPILARYNFLNNEYLQLYGQFGLSPNFYLKSNYIYTEKNGEINYRSEKDEGIRPINVGVVGAFGILFPLGDEWKLGIEAPLNAQILHSLRNRSYTKQWFCSYGLNIVVNRSF